MGELDARTTANFQRSRGTNTGARRLHSADWRRHRRITAACQRQSGLGAFGRPQFYFAVHRALRLKFVARLSQPARQRSLLWRGIQESVHQREGLAIVRQNGPEHGTSPRRRPAVLLEVDLAQDKPGSAGDWRETVLLSPGR